ncbi:DR2241 family protein [Halovivax limisalsi]|uniref:DR2241 family protein n=1 Tax=Halovivax limisalsi TaxID=1453760 RepID=UPI001FFC5E65|nr:DR2241 family protein [Halovivax limisalsi]
MSERAASPTTDGVTSGSLAATTLVLVGHGSHHSARSADPVYAHADRIRDRGAFAAVRTAFWKESPSPREVRRTVPTARAVVVPVFMAAGYFTETVLPRELGLDDASAVEGGTVAYAEPVGTHPAVSTVVGDRVDRLVGDRERDVGVAIVAHGTDRHAGSAAAARAHADRLREAGRYQEVRALYLDESPAVDALTDHFAAEDLVVVPLFVSDGPHARTDVPAAIGLVDGDRAVESGAAEPLDGAGDVVVAAGAGDEPVELDGHRVRYAGAVGTDPLLADVILDRAREARALTGASEPPATPTDSSARTDGAAPRSASGRAFVRWVHGGAAALPGGITDAHAPDTAADGDTQPPLEPGGRSDRRRARTWGQLWIAIPRESDPCRYELRHEADRGASRTELRDLDRIRDLRTAIRFDDEERFRPLRTAPTLPTGWRFVALDGRTLVRAVETVYPATIANWYRDRTDDLDVTHFRATAERQTGRYEDLETLDEHTVEAVAHACCDDGACLKRRCWEFDADATLDAASGSGRLPCREPCSQVLETAREFGLAGPDDGGVES